MMISPDSHKCLGQEVWDVSHGAPHGWELPAGWRCSKKHLQDQGNRVLVQV